MTVITSVVSCGKIEARMRVCVVEGNVWVLADVLLVFPGFLLNYTVNSQIKKNMGYLAFGILEEMYFSQGLWKLKSDQVKRRKRQSF